MKILNEKGNYYILPQYTIDEKFENKLYELDWDQYKRCFLRDFPDFFLGKVYDVNHGFRKRILKSFNHYDKNMGVLLVGGKGCGKTIDAKLICNESNLPVVIISKSIPYEVDFVSYLMSIEQDILVFIDEFEKNFLTYEPENGAHNHTQESFLSVMDGFNSKHKRLFLFTSNEEIDKHMMNRPSRIKYVKPYKGISEELAKEVVDDLLISKIYKRDLMENVDKTTCTIDILKGIIEEVNVQEVPYSEFKDEFNFKPETTIWNVHTSSNRKDWKLKSQYKDRTNCIIERDIFDLSIDGKYRVVHDLKYDKEAGIVEGHYIDEARKVHVKFENTDKITMFLW